MSASKINTERVQPDRDADKAEIKRAVEVYVQSINSGSVEAGLQVFDDSESTIFIHPRGTERGWTKIATDIYAFFGETFTSRNLRLAEEPGIHFYGDAAVVDFEWDFVATFRETEEPLHTTGRESQFYHKIAGKGWRIVHVHYSGPPITGAGEGF